MARTIVGILKFMTRSIVDILKFMTRSVVGILKLWPGQMTLSTDQNMNYVAFVCIVLFMMITNFMLKRVEHDKKLNHFAC